MLALFSWVIVALLGRCWGSTDCQDGDCDASNLLQKQQHQHSMSTRDSKDTSWAILEVTDYKVEGSWDWWSEGDIYAVVEVNPSKFNYKSEVQYDQNKGNLNLNIYVPANVGTIKVTLYDHHDTWDHDLVGSTSFSPATDCGADDVCSVTLKFRSSETVVEEVAQASARFIRGGAVKAHAKDCNKRGVWVHYEEESREKSKYKLTSVKADQIEKELLYAMSGSAFPKSLHGLHWMDQRATSLRKRGKYEEEPDYKHVCDLAAEEVFVSFGEAAWDPETKCVTGVRQYGGGPLSGHWSWLDQGGKTSAPWEMGKDWNMKYDFCFRDEEMTFIDVLTRISVSKVISSALGVGVFPPHVEVTMPTWINGVSMVKTAFGWDRLTTLGPSWLRSLIKATFESEMIQNVFNMGVGLGGDYPWLTGGMECHYPLLLIVDGDGNRTKYYQDYLDYTNNGTTCERKSYYDYFDCPLNRAPGTVVLGRLEPF